MGEDYLWIKKSKEKFFSAIIAFETSFCEI